MHTETGCLFLFTLLLAACSPPGRDAGKRTMTEPAGQAVLQPDTLIQAENDSAGFANVCTGHVISVTPETIITAPVSGTIRMAQVRPGTYVREGGTILLLESRELISLEQSYLEASYQSACYSEELKRQGELALEKATSLKKMQQAQLDFQLSETRKNALRIRLSSLGIHPDSLSYDHFQTVIPIRSPRSGYFGIIFAGERILVSEGEKTAVIRNDASRYVAVDVPETFYVKMKKGMALTGFFATEPQVARQLNITDIGRHIDPEKHTFRIRCSVENARGQLVDGMSVRVNIPK